MPNWKHLLQAMIVLAIGGFALVIVSGFWHVLALLLCFACIILWILRQVPRPTK